jgi:hypothetical protein
MIGADTTRGQVPWIASGTPGTPAYKTNGQLVAWQGLDATPLKALDAAGRAHTDSLFSGEVVALVYAQAVPSLNNTAAYFLTFLQRVQIKLMVNGTGVFSNLVLLQMADPLLIVEDPWLIIGDAVQGYIGQYRLGQSNDGSISGPTG